MMSSMLKPTPTILPGSLAEAILHEGDLNIFYRALQVTDLLDALKEEGPFTVFAPTDEAFNDFTDEDIDDLMADRDALTNLLLYHIVDGKFAGTYFTSPATLKTLTGQELTIDRHLFVNSDIVTKNGFLHIISAVQTPIGSPSP